MTQVMEEVAVTANKRAETLHEVPLSISVLNGTALEKRGAVSFQDLAFSVPSLSFRSAGPGRQTLTLRGLSSSAGSSPTVSFYVNESPIAMLSSTAGTSFQQVTPDVYLLDLQRIEVLRGPQGTLYGSSSLGGTVRFITREPVLDTSERSMSASASNTDKGEMNWTASGVVNLPLGKRSALRVAVSHTEDAGFMDRLVGDFSGPNRSATGPVQTLSNVDGSQISALRATLHFAATDHFYLQPMVLLNRIRQDNRSSFDRPPGDSFQQRVTLSFPEPYEDDFKLFSFTAGAQLPDLRLTSISTFTRRDMYMEENNSDSMYYSFGDGPELDPSTGRRTRDLFSPQWQTAVFRAIQSDDQGIRDFTQEFRLTSAAESKWQYLAGAYYKDTDTKGRLFFDVAGYSQAFPIYGNDPFLGQTFGDNLYTFSIRTKYREYALFGEVSYSLTSRLKATAGARWFDYKLDFTSVGSGFFTGFVEPATTVAPTAKDTGLNPRFILSYALRESSQLYGSLSKGARPGGPNAHGGDTQCAADLAALGRDSVPNDFAADSLWSLEAGWKNDFSRRLTVNAAAFLVNWSGVQQRFDLTSCGFSFVDNAGKARSKGLELETELLATDHWRMGFGLSYTDAYITKAAIGAPVVKGDRLLDSPQWIGNAWTEYSFPLNARLGAYVRADWGYTGNAAENFSDGRPLGTPDPFGTTRPGYDIADVSTGIVGQRWSARLFVNNLFDERAQYTRSETTGILYDALRRVVTNPPRTVGIAATMQF